MARSKANFFEQCESYRGHITGTYEYLGRKSSCMSFSILAGFQEGIPSQSFLSTADGDLKFYVGSSGSGMQLVAREGSLASFASRSGPLRRLSASSRADAALVAPSLVLFFAAPCFSHGLRERVVERKRSASPNEKCAWYVVGCPTASFPAAGVGRVRGGRGWGGRAGGRRLTVLTVFFMNVASILPDYIAPSYLPNNILREILIIIVEASNLCSLGFHL